jgi:hypothetical protein
MQSLFAKMSVLDLPSGMAGLTGQSPGLHLFRIVAKSRRPSDGALGPVFKEQRQKSFSIHALLSDVR